MASSQLGTIVRHLHQLAGGAQAGDASDAELLERFAARRDEAAFAALVKRHGPMVLAACRRVLGNHADAEDAFQATFLVLVRKAGAVRRRAALAGWLHEVALRVALRARTKAHNRRRHEQRVPDMPRKDFLTSVVWRDLQPVLDEEVQALPDSCREAFVLCYLEGKTYALAAAQLGCRPGTISRRLARARELLRARLTRRGLVLPAGMLAVVLSQQIALAALPAALIASTVKTALRTAAGAVPARVAALAEGGLQAMKVANTKIALALLLATGLVFGSTVVLAGSGRAAVDPNGAGETAPQAVAPEPPAAPQPRAEVGKDAGEVAQNVELSGQVLDAAGKPVAGAQVALFGRVKSAPRGTAYRSPLKLLAQVKTERDGRFRFAAVGLASSAYWTAFLIARAPGHGLGQHTLPLDTPCTAVKLRLLKERQLHGRLVDLQGQPAAGVTVQLAKLYGQPPIAQYFSVDCEQAPAGLKDWPGPVVSDAHGRFTLRGLPAGCKFTLLAHGGTFARQYLEVAAGAASANETILAVAPGRILSGTVTYRDTGKPAANARMRILSVRVEPAGAQRALAMSARTDTNGHFRVVPYDATYYVVAAFPPAGEPYLLLRKEVLWPRGLVRKQEVKMALRRGVRVTGIVKEVPGGKPVAGAVVEFEPRQSNNPFFTRDVRPQFVELNEPVLTGANGTFTMVVLPGPGHLLINGPTPDYLHSEILAKDLFGTGPGLSYRYYPDGLVALDLKPEVRTHRVEVTLRRGVPLKGRVLGPDGKAVASGHLLCRCYVPTGFTLNSPRGVAFKDGRFALPGWDPHNPDPVYVFSPELGLGGVLRIEKGQGDREATIRLQHVGGAKLRLVDPKGKPLAKAWVSITLPISPGVSAFDKNDSGGPEGTAEEVSLGKIDPRNFNDLRTDAKGRLELRGLIPGARHWVIVATGRGMVRMPVDVIPESGKTLDLKDVTVNVN